MSNVEVIRIGINLDIEKEILDRVRKPVSLSEEAEEKIAANAEKERQRDDRRREKDAWPARLELVHSFLVVKPRASKEELLEVAKVDPSQFRGFIMRLRRYLRDAGRELVKTTENSVVQYSLD